jgi:hypothetical protein
LPALLARAVHVSADMPKLAWLLGAAAVLLIACRPSEDVSVDPVDSTGGTGLRNVAPVGHVEALEDPESVRYDPDQDVYFISNMLGYGSAKDGAGYITRVLAGDITQSSVFAESGRNGVTLNAPKGMAIVGDTLWVADIDVLRGFDRRTGRPVGQVDFTAFHPTLLNDVGAGPNGTLRVSDSGLLMSDKGVLYKGGDRVFEMDSHRRVTVVATGPQLGHPNGVTWDRNTRRWLMVNFAPFGSALVSFAADSGNARQVLVDGPGKYDGVEVLGDGRVLYTCWNDSSVHVYANGEDHQLIRNLPTPADLGVDTKRGRIAVPLSGPGRVEIWALR